MTDLEKNPAVIKLLEYAKKKRTIGLSDLDDLLPEDLMSPETIPDILDILEGAGVQIKNEGMSESNSETDSDFQNSNDEDYQLLDDDYEDEDDDIKNPYSDDIETSYEEKEKPQHEPAKKMIKTSHEAGVDDPIKLYLQEIGKEDLLTADEEVSLSKSMEDGEAIIKKVIKNSGILIPEFFVIGQKAFSKLDPAESNKPRKELSEEMAEKKRLKQVYGDSLRNIYSEIKQYMSLKKHCYDRENLDSFLQNPDLQTLRKKILTA